MDPIDPQRKVREPAVFRRPLQDILIRHIPAGSVLEVEDTDEGHGVYPGLQCMHLLPVFRKGFYPVPRDKIHIRELPCTGPHPGHDRRPHGIGVEYDGDPANVRRNFLQETNRFSEVFRFQNPCYVRNPVKAVVGGRSVDAAENKGDSLVDIVPRHVLLGVVIRNVDQVRLPGVDDLPRFPPGLLLFTRRTPAFGVHLEHPVFRGHSPHAKLETVQLSIGPAPGRVVTHDVQDSVFPGRFAIAASARRPDR